MKALLIYSLYRRPQPTNEVEAAGFLPKDTVIDVAEIVTGKPIDKISSWYRSEDGFYYWGGGVQELQATVLTKFNFSADPFHTLINYNLSAFNTIPQAIKDTKGKGVRVAIIDTGLNQKHASFQSTDIKVGSNFTSSAAGTNDLNGHGSHVAGLIGGRLQSAASGIIGIAPLSELFIIKAIDDDGSTSAQDLNKAIKEAVDLGVQIINLSLDIAPDRYTIIESEINRAKDKGIIIVAAAGENDGLKINNTLLCPADKEGIVAIGSCDESNIHDPQLFQKKLDFIIPNFFFWSCFNENKIFSKERGSSMATAFVTGIMALILSSQNGDKDFVLRSLNKYALSFSEFKSGDICLLNPSK